MTLRFVGTTLSFKGRMASARCEVCPPCLPQCGMRTALMTSCTHLCPPPRPSSYYLFRFARTDQPQLARSTIRKRERSLFPQHMSSPPYKDCPWPVGPQLRSCSEILSQRGVPDGVAVSGSMCALSQRVPIHRTPLLFLSDSGHRPWQAQRP